MGNLIIWVVIAIGALIVDIVTTSFLFAGFTIGGIFAIIALILDYASIVQIVVFGIVSTGAIMVEYFWFRKKLTKSIPKTLKMEEEYIGRTIIADEDIDNRGRVKIEGVYWTAENAGSKILKGEKAEIIAIKGNKIIIKK